MKTAVRLSEVAREFLAEQRFAVLTTINPDGSPQQTVMWYELRGDEFVFNTARGRVKERNLARDPRASLVVADDYRYFRAEGAVVRIDDERTAQEDIRRLAIRYHGKERGEALSREQFSKQQRITYRMTMERVYAPGLQ